MDVMIKDMDNLSTKKENNNNPNEAQNNIFACLFILLELS